MFRDIIRRSVIILKRKITYTIIVFLVLAMTGLCVGFKIYQYLNEPINIKLSQIARVMTKEDLGDGGYWSEIYGNEHEAIKRFEINVPVVDFDKYNLVISTGRELKQLSYKRGETLPYGKDVYKGYTVFGKVLYPHTIFIYKINKINITEDDFSAPEEIVIED